MDYKFPWQQDWNRVKKAALKNLTSRFPNPSEDLTRTTLNQLPGIDRRTTFAFESVEQARAAFAGEIAADIYLRLTNPTIRELENMLTLLEARHFCGNLAVPDLPTKLGESPVKSLCFSCGMAAISHTLLALLNKGDTIITDQVLYGCTDNLFNTEFQVSKGINVVEINAEKLDEVEQAFNDNPDAKLIYFETPSNPTLGIKDIGAIAEIADRHNALVIVDNTFATPCLQNPLRLGADIVVHSLTKYINGHGDALGGSVTGPAQFIDGNDSGGLFYARRLYGGVMDPAQALGILRGIVSLPLRMEKHCDNAERVVSFLKTHPKVESVYFPGLETGNIAERQMRRFGGMVAFEIDANLEQTAKAINQVVEQEIGYIAVSLGLPYTLYDHPAGMTHYFVEPEQRVKKGITDTLIRLSIGLEDPERIINSIGNILEHAK